MGWELINHNFSSGEYVYGYFVGPKLQALRVDVPTTELERVMAENVEAEKASHGVRFGDWNRVASVPLALLNSTGLDTAVQMRDDKFVSKVLNDSDFAKFRTSRGRV